MPAPFYSRHALDALPQLVWVAGPDGTIEYLNRRCAEYSGLPLDDLLGWDWSWLVHPSDLPETLSTWAAAVRSGMPHELEHRLRRRDGQYRWFLVRAEPVRNTDGTVLHWLGTCTDVDDIRRRADGAQGAQMMFRALVERSFDGMALVGVDGAVLFANAAAARLLEFSSGDLTGTDLWGSVHPSDRNELRQWLTRVQASPGERLEIAVRFTRRAGPPRWVEVMATNLMPDPDVRALAVQLRSVDGD